MSNVSKAFTRATEHHQAGRLPQASGLYRKILAEDPNNLAALNNLAMIASQDEALGLLTRAVSLKPDYGDALCNLAKTLHAQGKFDEAATRYKQALDVTPDKEELYFYLGVTFQAHGNIDEALEAYQKAIALQPNFAAALYNLGALLQQQGKADEAIPYYERAVLVHPTLTAALYNLGAIHTAAHRYAAAAKWYRWALGIDPTMVGANTNMVTLLEMEGRLTEAKIFRTRVPRPQPLAIENAPTPHRTVLVLSTMGAGNVPIEMLLPRQTTTRIKWYVDYATDEQEQNLPPYDIAFNAIGNADITEPSLARLTRFYEHRPFLNAPQAVERTRRDLMPKLMEGIPNVVVPPVVRLRRDEVMNIDLAAKLTALGLTFPILARPLSTQGGEQFVFMETPEKLAEMTISDSDGFYFIAYHDYKFTDGYFRKYRMLFIDRKPHAYHLAISQNWLVHYFSADMLSAPWKREEEKRFLENPAKAIGEKAMAALEAIAKRMDLDYGGIDFSVLPDGRVLVFEANATMSLHLVGSVEDFPYKHVYVPALAKAFNDMLVRRVGK